VLRNLRVSVSAKNQPLNEVLDMMFRGTNVTYNIKGKNVTLRTVQHSHVERKRVTVSGFVRDLDTKEPLTGVAVSTADAATTTNVYGFYSLTTAEGDAVLHVSYVGYEEAQQPLKNLQANTKIDFNLMPEQELEELVVIGSRNEAIALESPDVGSSNISNTLIKKTPVVFGESDVVKTLQLEPGIAAGVEGFAGMYVHGGNADENMYMLDNIPLYQVNHFCGLFSAFNTSALRNVDFYKSSFPAKYDGRLSSYMDVHTKDGSLESHHGSFTLGLMSGAFNIDGPIKKGKTSYSLAVRRSWFDVLTVPICAIVNASGDDNEKMYVQFAFTDVNAKINHHFSDRSRAYVNFYFGDDRFNTHYKDAWTQSVDDDRNRMQWGNILGSVGWNYVFSPRLFGDITAAYTRYGSSLKRDWRVEDNYDDVTSYERDLYTNKNNISDWILRADYEWRPSATHRVSFGANYTYHNFLPQRNEHTITKNEISTYSCDSAQHFKASEFNAYIGDDWAISPRLRAAYGVHASLFHINGKTHAGFSPRAALRYSLSDAVALKGGYSRTTQYIHQLTQGYISLPTDQWVPITNRFKPQTADKVFAGGYWSPGNNYTLSVEAYYKWMDNLVDYRDEYYLMPQNGSFDEHLTTGKGTSKGIDVKLSKEVGRLSGHISYSLMWANRTFAERNHGETYPVQYDNRHKINLLLMWRINNTWEINASWTGQSGNMYTLATQMWTNEAFGNTDLAGNPRFFVEEYPAQAKLNNYRLPFYHRLDLGITRHTKRGYWTLSLYNAYNNMNTMSISYGNTKDGRPVFQKFKLFPIIPSFSYTWLF
jgi:hypothetical protein